MVNINQLKLFNHRTMQLFIEEVAIADIEDL